MSVHLAQITNGLVQISDEDRSVLAHRWVVVRPDGKKRYATTNIKGRTVYMHRLIMGAKKGQEVDHIDGDGLNNSRENLRIASRSQNCANRKSYKPKSGFRGVYAQPYGQTWQVKISVNGRMIRGGNFSNPEDAALRYDELAREHFGEFATLNFPSENP